MLITLILISSNVGTFFNNDAKQRFIQIFASKSVNSERGFIFNMEGDDF